MWESDSHCISCQLHLLVTSSRWCCLKRLKTDVPFSKHLHVSSPVGFKIKLWCWLVSLRALVLCCQYGLYMVAMPRVSLGGPIPSTLSRLRCLSLEFLWDLMGSPQVHDLGTSSCSHSCDRKSNSSVHLHVLSVENIVWQCNRSPGCKFHKKNCPKVQACFIYLAPIRTQNQI
jgi:hypothetical protein